MTLTTQEDVVLMRQAVRALALEIGLSLIDQTKVVTAASELARNAIVHGGGGTARLEIIRDNRPGIRLTFEDSGKGIPDLERAMTDGYTTGNGLGLGLGGSKRLSSEFSIRSTPGVGTSITITRWKGGV